ncbi:Phospholipase A1 [Gryllus bimaculatus]|nr:Phospholipase A1 [Gryllus bimaculatus]
MRRDTKNLEINPLTPEIVKLEDDSSSPSFNPKNPTRLVIHGWISNAQNLHGFRDAYIAAGDDYNIILVDWSGPAAADVPTAVQNAVLVGDYVGQVVNHLIGSRGLDPDQLVIIGHSMGGHVAGIVGNRLGGLAAEVIALDPANEIFDDNPLEDQLDITDAKFVQIIHTNGGGFGQPESRGHADFFPNGGIKQAGCGEDISGGCSHNIVLDFYIESIVSKDFVATLCANYHEFSQGGCSSNQHVAMGEWTPLSVSGSYYLNTNPNSPFAQGHTEL